MTKEQNRRCAINYLNELKASTSGYSVDWLNIAIKALEQQPSEDCISREAVKEMLSEEWTKYMPMELDINLSFVMEKISELPSVTPKSEYSWKEIKIKFECDDCISRQAVLDLTGKSDWFESSDDYNDFACAVCNLPSVKPTRPKGKWIIRPDRASDIEYRCSECGKIQFADDTNELNYCCNCGSKMEMEE